MYCLRLPSRTLLLSSNKTYDHISVICLLTTSLSCFPEQNPRRKPAEYDQITSDLPPLSCPGVFTLNTVIYDRFQQPHLQLRVTGSWTPVISWIIKFKGVFGWRFYIFFLTHWIFQNSLLTNIVHNCFMYPLHFSISDHFQATNTHNGWQRARSLISFLLNGAQREREREKETLYISKTAQWLFAELCSWYFHMYTLKTWEELSLLCFILINLS